MSRAVFAEGSDDGAGVSEEGEGEPEGMVWATVRKNSSMYWSDCGSYLKAISAWNGKRMVSGRDNKRPLGRYLLHERNSCVHPAIGHWETAIEGQILEA